MTLPGLVPRRGRDVRLFCGRRNERKDDRDQLPGDVGGPRDLDLQPFEQGEGEDRLDDERHDERT